MKIFYWEKQNYSFILKYHKGFINSNTKELKSLEMELLHQRDFSTLFELFKSDNILPKLEPKKKGQFLNSVNTL